MKNKIIASGTMLLACFMPLFSAEPKITFYIKPYPTVDDQVEQQRVVDKIKKPSNLAKKAVRATLEHSFVAGIFSLYAGYLGISNESGQIIFPRKHTAPKVTLVITPKITPVMMIGNTVHHTEVPKDTEAAFYSLERKKDKETGLFFWETKELPKPQDPVIEHDAIILFGHPKNLYVPIGVTVTSDSEHLVLPDIYAKKEFDTINNALYILNLKHFFGNINVLYKVVDPKGYASNLKY